MKSKPKSSSEKEQDDLVRLVAQNCINDLTSPSPPTSPVLPPPPTSPALLRPPTVRPLYHRAFSALHLCLQLPPVTTIHMSIYAGSIAIHVPTSNSPPPLPLLTPLDLVHLHLGLLWVHHHLFHFCCPHLCQLPRLPSALSSPSIRLRVSILL